MNLQQQANVITALHPWKKFEWGVDRSKDFNTWAFRYLIGCIAVGGSNESAVLEMAPKLFEKYPTIADLAKAHVDDVLWIIEHFGIRYSTAKVRYIIDTARLVLERHNGIVPNNRIELEQLPGVGRHVASVILATVFNQNEFAVDLHVRRIMERWGYKGSDLALEQLVRDNVSPDVWGHFSRAFVDFGQQRCGHAPMCSGCTVPDCGKKDHAVIKLANVVRKVPVSLEGYTINETAAGWTFQAPGSDKSCTVKANKTCNCTGFRFRRTCKHVEHIFPQS